MVSGHFGKFTKKIAFRTSLQFGISCLKRLNYDRNLLEDRRKNAENALVDVLVWSNERLIRWVANIGLKVTFASSFDIVYLIQIAGIR